jgi:hypothetical protein
VRKKLAGKEPLPVAMACVGKKYFQTKNSGFALDAGWLSLRITENDTYSLVERVVYKQKLCMQQQKQFQAR